MAQQVRPHHTETLFDGAAQSLRYGGIIRDRSGQLDNVNAKEVADATNFVMGSDAAEFVNKVNEQVRKTQRRMSNIAAAPSDASSEVQRLQELVSQFQAKLDAQGQDPDVPCVPTVKGLVRGMFRCPSSIRSLPS